MPKTLDEVRADAMALTIEERGALADSLWESLLTDEEREVQAAWVEEAERRYEEWQVGRAEAVSLDETARELRAKYEHVERSSRGS